MPVCVEGEGILNEGAYLKISMLKMMLYQYLCYHAITNERLSNNLISVYIFSPKT